MKAKGNNNQSTWPERLTRLRRRAIRQVFRDVAPAPSAFVAGSGRSGTTWVEDLINHRGDHRIVFEPFWAERVPLCRSFRDRQYLRPENNSPQFLNPARTIFAGDFRNEWTDPFSDRLIYRKRLVKDIRANLFLRWLHVHFPALPIVLVLRHPCAVAVSQIKYGWEWHLGDLLEQPELVEDFLAPFVEVIRGARDDFERAIILWCVENLVALRQSQPGDFLLIFYEEVIREPQREMERLFAFLGQSVTPEVFEKFGRPSELSRKDSAIKTGADMISSWRKHVSPAQMQRAGELLATFGLSDIYGEDPLPNPNAAASLHSRQTSELSPL